jgi:uncharacterized membrane protein YjgN (DUF898 family)
LLINSITIHGYKLISRVFIESQRWGAAKMQDKTLKPIELEFNGKAGEYFRIWIVNVLLSIVTLGIYSAWSKVRNKQPFKDNSLLNK